MESEILFFCQVLGLWALSWALLSSSVHRIQDQLLHSVASQPPRPCTDGPWTHVIQSCLDISTSMSQRHPGRLVSQGGTTIILAATPTPVLCCHFREWPGIQPCPASAFSHSKLIECSSPGNVDGKYGRDCSGVAVAETAQPLDQPTWTGVGINVGPT